MNNSEYYVNNNKYNYCTTIPNRISPCLRRDSYLSEFWSEEEKKLARDNLGITEIIDELRNLILNKLMGNDISYEQLLNKFKEYVTKNLLKADLEDLKDWINNISAGITQEVIDNIKENKNFITLNDSVANTNTKVGNILQTIAYNKNTFDKLLELDVDDILFHPAPINSTNGNDEEAAMTQKATKDYVDSSIQDIEVINNNSTLKWNQEETIATINGSEIKVKLPEKPTVGRVENETLIINSIIELITNGSYELTEGGNTDLDYGRLYTIAKVLGTDIKVTMPAKPVDNDTKNTTGTAQSANKLYIVGASSQSDIGVKTNTNSSVYIDNNELYSNNSKVITNVKEAIESLNDNDKNDLFNSLIESLDEETINLLVDKLKDPMGSMLSSLVSSVSWPEDTITASLSDTIAPKFKVLVTYSDGNTYQLEPTIKVYIDSNGNTEAANNWYEIPGTYYVKATVGEVDSDLLTYTIKKRYTVQFMNGDILIEKLTGAEGIPYQSPQQIPSKDGYTFNGWSTNINATQGQNNILSTFGGESLIIYYAIWRKNIYEVTLVINNGSTSSQQTQNIEYNGQATWIVLANSEYMLPTNVNHGTINGNTITSDPVTDNLIVTVNCIKKVSYSINWNDNGATTVHSGGSLSVIEGNQVILPTIKPKRIYTITWNSNGGNNYNPSGATTLIEYPFKGWYTSNENGTQITQNTIPTEDVTYYALWNNQTPRTITIPSIDPIKSGYEFMGWFSSPNGGTNITTGLNISITENIELYAMWRETVTKSAELSNYYLVRPKSSLESISWTGGGITPSEITSGLTGTLTKGTVTATYGNNTNITAEITTSNFENNPIITSSNTDVITIGEIVKNGSTTITAVGAGLATITVKDGSTTINEFNIEVTNANRTTDVTNSTEFSVSDGSINNTTVTAPNVTSDTSVTISAEYEGKIADETVYYTAIAAQQTTYYLYVGTTKPTSLSQANTVTSYPTEQIYTNNSGTKSHIFVLTNSDKTVTFINPTLNMEIDKVVDTTTISGYNISETAVGVANGGSVKIQIS